MADQKPRSLDREVSVAKSLFLGTVQEQNLFPFPKIKSEESETLQLVIDSISKFMQDKEEQFREFDRVGELSSEYLESLKELGLFGLIIPEEYGGIGLSNAGYSRVLQQTARFDGSTSLTIGAHSSIGMKGLILFGTDAQKKKYLPTLASGEILAAFCLTEPGSGSDAGSIKTQATKSSDGSWLLNGEKIWITNGCLAGFYTVFARTESNQGKMTAFIVEREWKGVSTGPKEDKMGIRASATTSVSFQDVQVPAENVLGGEGQGFKVAMSILNNGRTGLGGGCVGAMKALIAHGTKQAMERKQFGRPISEFELIKEKLAQSTITCFAAESAVQMVAHFIDSGVEDFSIEAAISKVFGTEALWHVGNEMLQIAGGNGFMRDFPYERAVRDSRINMIFEGTNEILRLYIGLSGMKDVGENLKELKKGISNAFADPIKGFGVFSGFVTKRVAQISPFGRDRIESVHPALREESAMLELYTQRFAQAVETVLMRHGKDIIGQQLITKRLAEMAIDLFVGLCVLSRVSRMITERSVAQCEQEISIAQVFIRQARRRMTFNLRRLVSNEDPQLRSISAGVLSHGGYRWDVF